MWLVIISNGRDYAPKTFGNAHSLAVMMFFIISYITLVIMLQYSHLTFVFERFDIAFQFNCAEIITCCRISHACMFNKTLGNVQLQTYSVFYRLSMRQTSGFLNRKIIYWRQGQEYYHYDNLVSVCSPVDITIVHSIIKKLAGRGP